MTKMTGQVAVITGAGSGIGRSTALLAAREGAIVHVVDRDAERAAEVAAEIREAGGEAWEHAVDVADAAAVERLAEEVFSRHAAVHLLMNNAGIGHAGPVDATPLEDWRALIEVNLMGVVHGVHAFVPRLLAQGAPSHIVNTASLAGLFPNARLVPYTTTKYAVVGLSESLNAELSPRGIRVTALCPGFIDTRIVAETRMRGELERSGERLVEFYRRRGTSPDVVARDALASVTGRHRLIVPSPWWQVGPAWMLHRLSPRLAQFFAQRSTRLIGGG